MSLWLWLFLYRIIPVGLGLGSLSHKSVIPEQQWSSMPEFWRETIYQVIVLSYRLLYRLPSRKRALSGLNSGEEVPKNVF